VAACRRALWLRFNKDDDDYYYYCTVISTLRWAVLTVLWLGFVTLGPFHCAYSFVFMCLYFCVFFHTEYICHYCNTVGWTWWDWSLILRTLSNFDALTLLIGSFKKLIPNMAYNVLGRTLNLTQPNPPPVSCDLVAGQKWVSQCDIRTSSWWWFHR